MHCKGARHHGDCPHDIALQQVIQAAEQEGWRSCVCGSIIELTYGCNHMSCRCGHQFCYVCGVRWRGCSCAPWQGQRLHSRAEMVLARQPLPAAGTRNSAGTLQAQFRTHQARLDTIAARLVGNPDHECPHPKNWRRFKGYHRCEICHKDKKETVGECKRCFIVACYHCRRFRM